MRNQRVQLRAVLAARIQTIPPLRLTQSHYRSAIPGQQDLVWIFPHRILSALGDPFLMVQQTHEPISGGLIDRE